MGQTTLLLDPGIRTEMVDVSAIKLGKRHRHDMGDIQALADNIADVGLLHPIVITPTRKLIAGARRLSAFRKLGRGQIPASIIDLDRLAAGEYAENTFRKAFTPSEIVAITDDLEPSERAKAKQRQQKAGKLNGRGKVGGISPKLSRAPRALDHVGKAVGKDRKTIAKAKAVVQAAAADPDTYRPIQDQMDRTGNVDRAHRMVAATRKRQEFAAQVEASASAAPTSQTVVHADCLTHIATLQAGTIDVVVTSPPYNVGVNYRSHEDNMPRADYLAWLVRVCTEIRRVLKPQGSLFLNIGSTSKDPWVVADVACALRDLFVLQNHIAWVKAVAIEEKMIGHFKPINSNRFLNQSHESVFHFTISGDVEIDRLAVGVPFEDKSNIARSGHAVDLHCAGDVWLIPYETAQSKSDKFDHPAGFPVELAVRCIKLHGLKAGMVVLDPFLGSGTTLVAAERLGCQGIGIESDEHYAKVATARLGAAV